MPTQERGFFTCNFCRLVCDTLEEANEHEFHCPKRSQQGPPQHHRLPPGQTGAPHYPQRHPVAAGSPYSPGGMAPLSTAELEGYGPPHHSYGPGGQHGTPHTPHKLRAMPLIGPNDRGTGISPEDSVVCQSIELFEATPSHAAEYDASRSGGTPVVVRQVGIRCIHCRKLPMSSAPYSTVFPSSLGSIAASVRLVADNHLSTCRMAPPDLRDACDRAAKRRQAAGSSEGRGHDEERNQFALLDYCVGFCQHMGIVNKQPHKTGIAFADTEVAHIPPHAPPTPGTTPASHRGQPPYSSDRMGPPMSYEHRGEQHPHMSRHGMQGMMGGPMSPADAIAPTPLQRRRDRPGADSSERQPPMYSADRSEGDPSVGYPTPYSQGPPGGDSSYGHDVQTPVQPNFEGKDSLYPTPHSAPPQSHSGESPSYVSYELPGNFPFYQETDRTWHCKFCSHVHPSYRDPQSIWSSASGGPPPGNFIDSHLSMCRAYHQSIPSPPMYQGGPMPPYGAPHAYMGGGYPPHPGWEGPSPTHGGGMHPQHLSYPPMGSHSGEMPYPPYSHQHMDHPPRPYPGGPEDPHYGDQRGRHSSQSPHPSGMPPHGGPIPHVGMPGRPGGPPRKESMGDSIRHSIAHLVARENDSFGGDANAAKADRLVLEEDKLLLTDYFFYLMKQLRLCRFSESDRKTRGGKREKIKLGYGGLQCIHCADIPNSRKFFWSNVDRLANSFAEIPGHVLKCRRCPQQTKDALATLKQFHPEQMARLPRGSQKVFFRRMWRRLHDEDPQAGASALADQTNAENVAPDKTEKAETPKPDVVDAKTEQETSSADGSHDSDESIVAMQYSTKEAAKVLAEAAQTGIPPSPTSRVLLAIPEDTEWLSDMDCFIRKQLEVFCANEIDVAAAQSDRKYPVHVGQVGIRCVHCSVSLNSRSDQATASGTAVAFPFAISGIYESVREFQRLHLDSCENVPASVKTKLAAFKGSSSLSSVLRKYYILAAKALGLQDTREGIRSGGESVSLGSQAAFSFAEGAPRMAEEVHRPSVSYPGELAGTLAPPARRATTPPIKSEEIASNKRGEKPTATEEEPLVKKAKMENDVKEENSESDENHNQQEEESNGHQV